MMYASKMFQASRKDQKGNMNEMAEIHEMRMGKLPVLGFANVDRQPSNIELPLGSSNSKS